MEKYEYQIFIGCDDKHLKREYVPQKELIDIVVNFFKRNNVDFSLFKMSGGYTHGKGYTTETSLRIIIIGINEQEVKLLSQKLKERINTDEVLITKTEIEYCFI